MHAAALSGMRVLISYVYKSGWIGKYVPSFSGWLADSGAYSEFSTGKPVDLDGFASWASEIRHGADHVAALDDINGDWRKGLDRWDLMPWSFPTIHDTDPPQALDAILERMCDLDRARIRTGSAQWIGIGMRPPRTSRDWLVSVLRKIPPHIHTHGFALRAYAREFATLRGREFSLDSCNWWLDSRKVLEAFPHLTPAEAIEVIVKRYKREPFPQKTDCSEQGSLW